MKYVILLEKDTRAQAEIKEALRKINQDFQVLSFQKLEELANWVNELIKDGVANTLGKNGDDSPMVPLMILERDQLGRNKNQLLTQMRSLFIRRGLCTFQDPVGCILTSFDNFDLDRKDIEDPSITNIIFKPFDKLILEEHLKLAAAGIKVESKGGDLFHMQAKSKVEMLKDIELVSFCEYGFVTKTEEPVTEGRISKYYSTLFEINRTNYAYGECVYNQKVKDKNYYLSYFQFVAMETPFINHMRKVVMKAAKIPFNLPYYSKKTTPTRVRQWAMDDDKRDKISAMLKEFVQFLPCSIVTKEEAQAVSSVAPTDLLVVLKEDYAHVRTFAEPSQIIVISFDKIDEDFLREAEGAMDVITLLADRMYIKSKVKFLSSRNTEMPWELVQKSESIQSGNPVDVVEVSESGIFITYAKPMKIGTFRKFLMLLDKEATNTPFTATCNSIKKNEKGEYVHHFVFFGMTDAYLKRIRLWIRNTFIEKKQDTP
ncbi:MAG: hypothetical protein V4736_03070 [Bdellovibrionota bacterium]